MNILCRCHHCTKTHTLTVIIQIVQNCIQIISYKCYQLVQDVYLFAVEFFYLFWKIHYLYPCCLLTLSCSTSVLLIPTPCYHAHISAMWVLLTWWPSCKLCVGYLVSFYAFSPTFIHSRNFVYLLQSSASYRQLQSCVL